MRGAALCACLVLGAGLVLGAAACGKPSSEGATPAGASASSVAPASAGGAAAAAPSASVAAGGTPASTRSWRGGYKSAPAALTIADGWKKVHWSDTQSTAGVGDGTLSLVADASTGRVTGGLEGPLGPAPLARAPAGGQLSASEARTNPTTR